MNVLYWNARGIANAPTQEALKEMCRKFQPKFVCIAEPMVDLSGVSSSFWRFLGFNLVGVNDRGSLLPNIWLFASNEAIGRGIQVVNNVGQHITISLNFQNVSCYVTCVYASTAYGVRRKLWSSLLATKPDPSPWLVIGDFNSVLGTHEVCGGHPPPRISCKEFQATIDECGLIHVLVHGSLFTWVKTFRNPFSRIERRLDRALCNASWLAKWPLSVSISHVWVSSDNHPLVFKVNSAVGKPPTSFRFLNAWCSHPSFLAVVKQVWDSTSFSCNYMQTVMNKLKATKKQLILWNKDTFGNIHQMVECKSTALKQIQDAISISSATAQLLQLESVAHTELSNALLQQEQYWKQKSRQMWLKEGDRNSKFFHTCAKIKVAKAQISCLVDGSNMITDACTIEDRILAYYKTLYSSSLVVQDSPLLDMFLV
ncbi:hypothetical protein LguiA_003828 [Lonicera macranthoides]